MAHNRYSFRHHILQDQKDRLHLHSLCVAGVSPPASTQDNLPPPQHGAAGPGECGRPLFDPRPPHSGQGEASPSACVSGPCRGVRELPHCRWLRYSGQVKNCILFRGVRVEKGAQVENCVLFKGTVVKKDATLRCVIADKAVTIREGRTLIGDESYPVVVARNATV